MPKQVKPGKPYPEFPLTPHPNGTWCKKIKGVLYHFGGWSDPEAAREQYLRQVGDIQAGRGQIKFVESTTGTNALTVKDLCNRFLNSKRVKVASGERSHTTRLTMESSYVMTSSQD